MSASATCLSDDFPAVLALVADVVRHPAFPEAEVTTRRADLISSIRKEQDNPAQMAVDAFVRALYGSHPYSRKVRGTVETVEALKRQDLVRCYQKGLVPSGVIVVVVGDVDEELAVQTISRSFADWSGRRGWSGRGARRRAPVNPQPRGRADDEQVAGRCRVRVRRHPPARSGLHGECRHEQRARPVRHRRTARRQHPRAAGDGVLRLQLARCRLRRRAADDSRRRVRGERRAHHCVDRHRADGGAHRRLHPAGDRRVEGVSDWLACRASSKPTARLPRSC